MAEGEEAGVSGGEVGGEDEVEEGRDEARGMPRAVYVCVLFGDGHTFITMKSTLDLLSHVFVYHVNIYWVKVVYSVSQRWHHSQHMG